LVAVKTPGNDEEIDQYPFVKRYTKEEDMGGYCKWIEIN
jgi:hypothetical protein